MSIPFYSRADSSPPPFNFDLHQGLLLDDPVARTASNEDLYPVQMTGAQLAAIFWRLDSISLTRSGWDGDSTILGPIFNHWSNPRFVAALPCITRSTGFEGTFYLPHATTQDDSAPNSFYGKYRPSARGSGGWYPWLGNREVLSALKDGSTTVFVPVNEDPFCEYGTLTTTYTVADALIVQVNSTPCGSAVPLYAFVYGSGHEVLSGTVTLNFLTT